MFLPLREYCLILFIHPLVDTTRSLEAKYPLQKWNKLSCLSWTFKEAMCTLTLIVILDPFSSLLSNRDELKTVKNQTCQISIIFLHNVIMIWNIWKDTTNI